MKLKSILFVLFITSFLVNAAGQDSYYISKKLDVSYEKAIERLKTELKKEGFGVVSETAMHETINSKIPGSDMDPYVAIGACNAKYAKKVIGLEENIGLFLPCKILVKYTSDESSEVVIINPKVAMSVVENKEANAIFDEVTEKLKNVLKSL